MNDIRKFDLFEGIAPAQLGELQEASVVQPVDKGGIVFLPGEESECAYLIIEGRVKISKISENGKELTLAYHEMGELFGEQTLLEGEPRQSMAISLVNSRFLVLPREELIRLAKASSVFALRLGTIIGRRRHELERRMESLVFRDVPARLAMQLIALAERYGVEADEGAVEIDIKLSQLELANMIGATRETTSTALNELKRAGVLETSHRTIVICNLEKLREIGEQL